MQGGLLAVMRKRGGAVSVLVALAFALSILAAALPAGGPSSGTLLADLAASICKPGQEVPGEGSLPQHEPCCILCAAGTPPIAGPLSGGGTALNRQAEPAFAIPAFTGLAVPRPGLRLTALIPRGPPAA